MLLVTALAVGAYYYWKPAEQSRSETHDSTSIAVGSLWIPVYPNALLVGRTSSTQADAIHTSFQLKSKDEPGDVLNFYRTRLKSGPFWSPGVQPSEDGGTIQGVAKGGKIKVFVTVRSVPAGSEGTITTIEKTDKTK